MPSVAIRDDEDFAQLFEVRGRPAKFAPWRLALVAVMQDSKAVTTMRLLGSTSDFTFAEVPNPMAQAAREVHR